MITLCWSAKGGSGTTVVAAAMALLSPRSLVVDLAGDVASVYGLPTTDQPGAADWVASDAPPEHIVDLFVHVDDDTTLIPHRRRRGRRPVDTHASTNDTRWDALGSWLRSRSTDRDESVIVDTGLGPPPEPLLRHSDRNLLVTRPCYLALTRATAMSFTPTGIIVIDEPGRTLGTRDVERAVGAPVIATISYDLTITRAVDSGLLSRRLPAELRKRLEGLVA